MDDLDALIGKNLARLRGDKSQADMAKEMKERGFKWSQATVWSIEKGERPLRLAEAQHLAEILGLGSFHGLSTFLEADATAQLRGAIAPVVKAHAAMEDAISAFLRAQDDLAETADFISEKAPPSTENSDFVWSVVHSWLVEHSPRKSAVHLEKVHLTDWMGDLPDEMADLGVTNIHQLVDARNAAAREEGYEDYETKYAQNMRMGGNYSGMHYNRVAREDNGVDSEEA